jgi:hypothetical protein
MVTTHNEQYILEFIPKNLQYLTQQKTIQYNGVNLKCTYLTNIIHELISKYYFSFNTNVSFNLSSVILRKKYGEKYNYYMSYLVDQKILNMVCDYHVNVKSRTYKLVDSYIDDELIRYKCVDTFLLKKAKGRYEVSISEKNLNTIPLDIKQKMIQSLYKIKIDYVNALKYIDELKDCNQITENKYRKNKFTINNIKNSEIFFNFDDYGRFHNNFTTLKKEIRNDFLTINNETLGEVDIKNSQPFFLSVMLKNELKHINNDTQRFIDLTASGLIYEDILEKSKLKSREEAKELMYYVLFEDNKEYYKYDKIFKKLYPSVYEYIWEFKNTRTHKDVTIEKKYQYKEMSHELQRMESKFIYNVVIKEIYETYPNIILFTVHDSIIFPKSYQERVEKIFNKHFSELKKSLTN